MKIYNKQTPQKKIIYKYYNHAVLFKYLTKVIQFLIKTVEIRFGLPKTKSQKKKEYS